jgi:methylmalonyl-CoA/ethylmalonyl-CoA epimerase
MPAVRFDHIAIAVPRMADAVPVLSGILGGRPSFGATSRAYRFGQWVFEGGGRIEVLEPTGSDGFLARFLERHGPGVHHVTFKVPSLREACARARAQGYEIVGLDESDPHWQEAFLHPRQALGIVVQMAQFTAAGAPRPPRRWEPPAVVADPPPAVRIVGLRSSAHSRERAHRQWHAVLGGTREEAPDGALVYRWAESPLRLAIEIDPARAEGPLAIEYGAGRAVALTAESSRILGTVFASPR